MLLELTIQNFAIIPKLHLSFSEGMTVLTGETGAGKSIIIDAMALLAGGRGLTEYIRQGSEKCLIEGVFEFPQEEEFHELMKELGIDENEEVLIIQRDITNAGKSMCRVNGRSMTLSNLRRIGSFLVDIQGQNEHQDLLQEEKHLGLLDSYGSSDYQAQLVSFKNDYASYRQLEKQVRRIQENEQSFVQRLDMLHFQQEEIEQAKLSLGEEEELIEERDKLMNFQKIVDAFGLSYGLLSSESGNSLDGISMAITQLEDIAHLDSEYEQINENVQSAYFLLQEATTEMSRQLDHMEMDEGRLEEVEERLELIRQLKRKYGDSIATILKYYDEISEELLQVTNSEDRLEELESQLAEKEKGIEQFADKLHNQRKKLAYKLEREIVQELAELYMEHAQFEVHFHPERNLSASGFDKVEFYLTTNPGEPLKPLVKVASGGELSRILLALKSIFSKNQRKTSIVFDEVDTGVSGRVAQAIAEKIVKISRQSQVLCITHLPQVAAVATHHYFISKEVKGGRTQTHVRPLDKKERVEEIARMLSGAEITELTIEHAEELLKMAQTN